MDVRELKEILKRIEELYAAGGASTAAKDLRAVARLLEGYEGKNLETFIADTKAFLEKPKEGSSQTTDDEMVASSADRLLAAGIDQAAFDAALKELDESPAGKNEWAAIANRYRNAPTNATHVYKFKSIREARMAIRDAFIERREANSKHGIINQLTKWPRAL
jgi:hypothetical protein